MQKPDTKPQNPHFSAGPTSKHPGWTFDALRGAALGRSHRSKVGKAKLKEVIDKSAALLELPEDYVLGIVPASDTGAVEMAMWSLLGPRGVDVLAWENFSSDWVKDCKNQLPLDDLRIIEADYGKLPDLASVDFTRDVIFPWNGTTSGVCVPHADWIPATREGLTICDATSAVFAMDMDYTKLDVITWSWQKVLGSEAAHGMLALSPRAVARLEGHTPSWPIPKLFQLTKGGKLNSGIFEGATINTPSMLAVEDVLSALHWVSSIGGLRAMIGRANANLAAVQSWVEKSDWAAFLAEDPATLSNTSLCLKITHPDYQALNAEAQAMLAKNMVSLLEKEGVAYDIAAYRTAPPGIRIWGGGTVETADIAALLPWLDWAWAELHASIQTQAA
jgi:phosphoserine aminotransferase